MKEKMRNELRFKSKAVCFAVMLVLLFTLPWPAAAKKVVAFDINFKYPGLAAVTEKGFYVYDWDVMEIYFFPRETLRPAFKFGGRGEGPSEFKWITNVNVCRDYVFVSAGGKNVYFSLDGKYLKEIRTEHGSLKYIPLGDNFVCRKDTEAITAIKILDKNLRVKKENLDTFALNSDYRLAANKKRDRWMFRDYFNYAVYEDKLIVANSQKGFYFGVYDSEGSLLYEIKRDYKKVPITAKDKEGIMKQWRDAVGEQRFQAETNRFNILWPEYYPAYATFFAANGKINVITFKEKDGMDELLVFDMRGKLLNQGYVPFAGDNDHDYFIFNGSFYYFHENEETDKWELHELKID